MKPRIHLPKKIVLASSNHGKIDEFNMLFSPLNVTLVPQHSFYMDVVKEDKTTFIENALLKARYAAKKTHLAAIADDSGLIVDALNGEPGIFSARYAGEKATDKENNDKLLNALKDIPLNQRTARFHCSFVFLYHENDPNPLIFQGDWDGVILFECRGQGGFGYDPLFYVPQQQCTSAELLPQLKNTLSHRAQAMEKFRKMLSDYAASSTGE